jgi:hypothetical protein
MANYIQMPNGVYFPALEGEDYETTVRAAKEKYPEAYGLTKEAPAAPTGVVAAATRGTKAYLSQSQTALQGPSTESALAGIERGKELERQNPSQLGWDKVKAAYEQGLMPAAKEVARQVPLAIAEQVPNLAGMAAGARLGAMAGAPFGGVGAIGGGALGALLGQGAASYLPQAGGNIEAQAQAQLERGEPVNVSGAKAYGAAVPQAAIDVVENKLLFGGRGVLARLMGTSDAVLAKKSAIELERLAQEKIVPLLLKGTTKGAATQIPGEIIQDILQRAQAGQELTSPEALRGYGETAFQVGLLGPLGAVGRLSERSGAKAELEIKQLEDQQKAQQAGLQQQQQAAQQAQLDKLKPEYAAEVTQKYQDLQAQAQQFQAAMNAKVEKDDFAGQQAKDDAKKAYAEFRKSDEFRQTLRDYMELKATSPAAVTPATPPAPPAQTPQMQAAVAAQQAFENKPPAPPVEVQTTTPMPEPAELHATMQAFAKRLEDNQQAQSDAAAKADTEALKGLHTQYLDLTQQHAQAAQDLKDAGGYNAPKVPVEEIARLQKSIDRETTKLTAMAGPGFDPAVAAKAVARIERLKAELDPYQRQTLLEGRPNEAFMGAAREREAGAQEATAVQEQGRRDALFNTTDQNLGGRHGLANLRLLSAAREQITPEQAASVQREGKVGAETAALQRIGATEVQRPFPKEAPATESEIPYVDELIAALPQGHTITPGAIRQGLGADKRNASDLRAQLAIATETKNREAKLEAINGLQALRDQNKERAARGALGAEKTQAELGFGTMPEGRAKEAAADMHADKQNNILVQMVKTLDSLIRGRIPGTLTLNTGRIQQQFDAQKEAYVASQLAEINARRSAFGVPPMADWEAGNARARVMDALTELHERWGKADGVRPSDFTDRKEAVRAIQQHMRDNVYETVLTGAQRLQDVSKGEMSEKTGSTTTHYTSRLDDRGKPIAIPPAKKGSRIAAPDELTLREAPRGAATDKQEAINLVEHILSTVGRRTRAVPTEAVKAPTKVGSLADMKALFAAEKSGETSGKTDPATLHFLEQLAEILPKTNAADFIKMAREQAQQVMEGNLPSIHAVQALEEMAATHKGVSQIGEATQRQLFEGVDSRLAVERKDSWNFLNLLESESVQKVKEGIAKQRQANIDALNQARDVLITNKDTIAAEQKYQATLKKAQKQAAPLAEQLAVQRGQAELAKEILDPLRKSLADVQMQLDHVQAVKDRIAAGPTGKPVERAAPLSESDKDQLHKLVTQREYIALAEKALKRTTLTPEQRAVIEKQLAAARKAVEVTIAKPEVQKLLGMGTRPPSTRLDNLWTPEFLKSVPNVLAQETALKARKQELRVAIETAEKMGEEVQANIVALEKQLAATEGTATEDIAQAQEALGQAKEAKASKKRAAAVPETVSRVAEEEYQASLQNAREGMGLEGIRHEVDTADRETKQRVDAVRSKLGSLNDQLVNAAPEAKAEIQAKIDAAEEKLSSVFNLATRRVVQLKEEGQQDLEDAFTMRDTMTQAAKDARARRKSGEAAPALPQAREGPVVRPVGAGQGRVSESGTTKYQGKEVSAIDTLAEKRAELREIQRRMDFLRTNKKDKAANRLTPVYKDLQAQEATAIAEVHAAEKAVLAEKKAAENAVASVSEEAAIRRQNAQRARQVELQARTTWLDDAIAKEKAKAKPDKALLRTYEEERVKLEGGVISNTIAATDERALWGAEDRLVSRAEDRLLSRGKPEQGSTKAQAIADIEKAMGTKVTGRVFSAYESVGAFLKAHPEFKGAIPDDAKAFTHNGRAVMFAENIGKDEAIGVFLHEVGTHIGFRNFFNESQYKGIVSAVKQWAAKNDGSIESRVGKSAMERMEAAKTEAVQRDDELIAYAVEEAVKAGVSPAGFKSGSAIANWLRAVVNAFKAALSKIGIDPQSLNAIDLVNFAYGCAHLELHGTWHGTGPKVFHEFDHSYMGSGEGAQAFTWGGYRAESHGIADTYKTREEAKANAARSNAPAWDAWKKENAVTFDGKNIQELLAEADATGKIEGFPTDGPDSRSMIGTSNISQIISIMREVESSLVNGYAHNTVGAVLRRYTDGINKNKNLSRWPAEKVAHLYNLIEWAANPENIKRFSAPLDDVTYQGIHYFDAEPSVLRPVGAVAQNIEDGMHVQQALADAITEEEHSVKIWTDAAKYSHADPQALKKAQESLKILHTLDPNDFAYRKPTERPPAPKGNMLRTLHTYPEEAYLEYKKPLLDQSQRVKDGMAAAYQSLTPAQQKMFRRLYASSKQDAAGAYDALSGALESESDASKLLLKHGVAGNKFLDSASRHKKVTDKSRYNYVDFGDKEEGAAILGHNIEPIGEAKGIFFSRGAPSAFIGKEAGKYETFRGNFMGLAGRTQFVDRLAAADAGIVAAEGAGKLSSMEAFQAQYFMRMGDQVSQAAGQFITSGPMGIVKDNKTGEFRYESSKGANLKRMADYIEKAGVGEQEGERMLTALVAGERAEATTNGWNRLFASDPQAARAEYLADKAYLAAHPEAKKWMDAAKTEYKQYNDGLIDFAVQCGIISKDEGKRLQAKPYIPFYRVENGVVNLYMDSEHAFRIGDITNDPELKRMVGDNQHILPILTSAVQNTFMLTRMSMQNKTTMEVNNAMYKAGFVSKMGAGPGPASPDTVRYRVDGMPHFAVIDSDTFGIPAHLIVKGMEGIKTNLPLLVQALGIPADWVRKFVTRSPAYAVRQLIRDPINAFILSGVDGVPVVGALKQLTKMQMGRSPTEESLMRGLAISSNVFSGNEKDMQKFLKDIVAGKSTWDKTLAKMDTLALQADAATRATIYEDSIAKGMSVAQAQFRALESQNFSRRGVSPTTHMLSTMIPFFNAQIQGLDVLYRSMTGKMPFSQKLDIQRKIMARGAMLMTGSLAYALMMQDDEEYKKLSPEERYGNFLVPVPGFKNKLKVPRPYEAGILFMALPEAVVNAAMSDTKAAEAALGIGKLLLNSAPGIVPVGPKPLLEAAYGATTRGPIESRHEKHMQATSRYREDTPEALRLAGQATGMFGVSAVMLTHLVRGYTSTLGLSALHMLDPLLADKAAGEKATAEEAKLPFVGGLFQREGRFLIDRAYDRMDEVNQAKGTYDNLVERGQKAEAKAFAQRFASQLAAADTAGEMKQQMGELYKMERVIREHPTMTTERKDALLAKLKLAENKYAEKFVTLVDRTTHP